MTYIGMSKQYKLIVYGRPKNKSVDDFMDELNKTYQEIAGEDKKVHLNGQLFEVNIKAKKGELKDEELVEIKSGITKLIEDKVSDITFKLQEVN